jgi:hypothetical protein
MFQRLAFRNAYFEALRKGVPIRIAEYYAKMVVGQ